MTAPETDRLANALGQFSAWLRWHNPVVGPITVSIANPSYVTISMQPPVSFTPDVQRAFVEEWAGLVGNPVTESMNEEFAPERPLWFEATGPVGPSLRVHVFAHLPAPDNAGCSCGWRGASADIDAHVEVCLLPDPEDVPSDLAEVSA